MTDTPTVIEVDCETGSTTERPMTGAEIAQRETDAAAHAAQVAAEEAAQTAKDAARTSALAKLEALGLNAAEAAAIIGA